MDFALQFLTLVCHALAALAVAVSIAWLFREVRRASPTLGLIMAAGLLLRVVLGLTLFWIAERNLPLLEPLRTPDGIWTFALDSAAYLHDAATMATQGDIAMPWVAPDYVLWLTAWMRLLGTSAATAPFLNLTLFALVCWLIVRTATPVGRDRDDLPQLMATGSFAFSPALLLHGSQALKDDLCAALIAVSCVGARYLFSHPHDASGGSRRRAIGLLTMLVAGYLLLGLRDYVVGLIGGAAVAVAVLPSAHGSSAARVLALRASTLLFVGGVVAVSLWIGVAGDRVAARVESGRRVAVATGWKALRTPDRLRNNFHRTGGNTNLAEGPIPARGEKAPSLSWPERGRALTTGVAAIFIPMTVLEATGAVDLRIGTALRVATDVDTLFLDASILAALVLLVRRPAVARWHLRYVCFALLFGLITTSLMAYVVTNFGTLFRLRVMLAVPIWMLCLAILRGPLPSVRRVRYAEFTDIIERT